VALQKRLVDAFPFCTDLSDRSEHGFVPHLSVGQWKTEKDMQKKKEEFLAHWQKLSYEVDGVYLISRVGEEPFEIRYIVKFDGSVVPVKVVQEKCVLSISFPHCPPPARPQSLNPSSYLLALGHLILDNLQKPFLLETLHLAPQKMI
jgi:hypothetical protein